MTLNVSINNKEIKNPIIRFILGFIGSMFALALLTTIFFLMLPVFWFIFVITLMTGFVTTVMILKFLQKNIFSINQRSLTDQEKQNPSTKK